MRLVVAYSSDDNYAQHTGVSIVSLFNNNKEFDAIDVYIIDNEISSANKKKLLDIAGKYKRDISFIDFNENKKKLNLNMPWNISISSYARLFLGSMLPSDIKKVLYFDCDTVIVTSLFELWNENIEQYYIAAVQDSVSNDIKKAVGVDIHHKYVNAGMLLINLQKWRDENIESKFIKFIQNKNGRVIHHDQGVINGVLGSNIKVVSLRYNLMTVYYTMKRNDIVKYYGIEGDFYSDKEINEAINKPVYIHFTPGFTTRPWIKGCKHPMKDEYWKYLRLTPWKDYIAEKDKRNIKIKLISFLYQKFSLWKIIKI